MDIPARINLVTLGVADVAASTAFYEKLGWTKSAGGSNAEVTFLKLDNLVLGLFGADDLAADMKRAEPGGTGNFSLAINLDSEQAVDRAMEKALAAGATLLKTPERVFWGGYSGYFADPDGHPWELAFNPVFGLDKNNMMALPD